MMSEYAKKLFYLKSGSKELFCIYHYPLGRTISHQILYVHPFGDEMNKSRRIVSLQCEAFAGKGVAVLILDLFGCGDSEGEFRDATWDIWIENIAHGYEWLKEKNGELISLWGLRMGCLLISDFLKSTALDIDQIIFWQPVISGKLLARQLKRQKMATGLFSSGEQQDFESVLRQQGLVEVSGYEISETLYISIEKVELTSFPLKSCRSVIWKELSLTDKRKMLPASQRIIDNWISRMSLLDVEVLQGKAFWNTVEIETNSELVESTLESFGKISVIAHE